MLLKELFAGLAGVDGQSLLANHSHWEREVTGLCANSQAIEPGNLFIGMPGTRVDGGEFWQGAVEKGAIAALISPQALAAKPAADSEALVLTSRSIPQHCRNQPDEHCLTRAVSQWEKALCVRLFFHTPASGCTRSLG